MNISIFVIACIVYIALLFYIAYFTEKRADRGRSLAKNPYVYALSLAVYCTAWTFYGSVGKAVKSGLGFIPIYLGPTICAPLWFIVLRKMILISKSQRITSIADFISSRYGKSTFLGVLVTVIAFFGIIPYISLQLKAIADSFEILTSMMSGTHDTEGSPFYYSTAFYISIALALFTILFGTRNIEPNERHEGLVNAIAFESIVKLVAFLAVGIFATFFMFDGFPDLIAKANANDKTVKLLSFGEGIAPTEWFWLNILSMFAIFLLPRQFHIAVVENTNPRHVSKALWLFPVYLLAINVFVLPIAIAGTLELSHLGVRPDTYVLALPLSKHQYWLALLVFIGGFSASTGMVIVETTALSIMVSNHIVMPPLLTTLVNRDNDKTDFTRWIKTVRRISIIFILLLAFGYVRTIATNRELVSIGLVSFAAVLQFAPSLLGGLFWKGATKSGAIAGLVVGFIVWAMTLPIPTLAEYKIFDPMLIAEGYFGQWWLKPYALFGLTDYDYISHATFWSLVLNVTAFVGVSVYTKQLPIEVTQADYFVNIYKYLSHGSEMEVVRREAKMQDLLFLLNRFLGEERTTFLLKLYEEENKVSLTKVAKANAELVNYVETLLAGAIGASSAKILLGSVVKEDPISLEEMLRVLDQTQEIIVTNRELERKSRELEQTTRQLQIANDQLKELDRLKADFITTVTHELRTPMTSIKALSKILLDNKDLPAEKQQEFLQIVVSETERISRLVNQVLDIEKLQSDAHEWRIERINLTELVQRTYKGSTAMWDERNIAHALYTEGADLYIQGDADRITQVLVNLIGNATKFADAERGQVAIAFSQHNNKAILRVQDNGIGIEPENQRIIFERFTQINNPTLGKPQGSGLGLFITKRIVEYHHGTIRVESEVGKGATFIVELPLSE